ncbi:MAG TPA: GNAT family N-acetyltransferase [Bacteroidota bacterium]|nr:GNAT family N-acetyltransferase [Bacteroidota bacterium]
MLQVREHSSFAEARPWAEKWNSIILESSGGEVFRSYEWMSIWWEGFARRGMKLLLLSVWDGEELVGVAPLMVCRTWFGVIPVRALELVSMWKYAGSAASVLGSADIVARGDEEAVAREIVAYLSSGSRRWDLVRFHPLKENSALLAALEESSRREGRAFRLRHVFDNAVLHVDQGLVLFRQNLSPKFRARLRQSEAKLRRRGNLGYSEVSSPDGIQAAWDAVMEVERRSWKWTKGITINSAAYRDFYRILAARLSEAGWLRLGFLHFQGRPVAYSLMAKTGSSAVFLKTGYDESLADCSPGSISMLIAFERLAAEGVSRINMLSGDWEYKSKWHAVPEPHCEALLFDGGIYGRLLHLLYFRVGLYERGRVPILTFKRILRKCGIPYPNSELTRSDQLWFSRGQPR